MNNRINIFCLISGIVCLITAFLHLIAGQANVIQPFLKSGLLPDAKYTLLACWHMITAYLFTSGCMLIYIGITPGFKAGIVLSRFIGVQFIAFAIIFLIINFMVSSPKFFLSLPQWILLLPIGLLAIKGKQK